MAASTTSVRVKARVVIELPEGLCEQTRQTTNPIIALRAMADKLRPYLLMKPSVLQPMERSEDTSLSRHIIARSKLPSRDVPSRDIENVEFQMFGNR